jgi:hypothetical protein
MPPMAAAASSRPQYRIPAIAARETRSGSTWAAAALARPRRRRPPADAPAARAARAASPAAPEQQGGDEAAYARGFAAGLLAARAAAPDPPPLARSAAKGVSWRVFSAAVTVSLAAAVFGRSAFEEAGGAAALGRFAAAEFLVKLGAYVAHERLWAWIDGRAGGAGRG